MVRIRPYPGCEKLKFARESVVQVKVDSEIAAVLLLLQGESGLECRLSKRIVTIECLLPDIYALERDRTQDRLRQTIGFNEFRIF
jgi:hypothetical protein